jgi:hypothetical protein
VANTKAKVDKGVRLGELERAHRSRVVEIDAQIAAVEPNVGVAVIEAELAGAESPSAGFVEELRALRSERVVEVQAAAAAFEARVEVQHEVWHAEAAVLRRQAAEKRAEAAKHAAKTCEFLEALRAHEGVEYVPASAVAEARWRMTAGSGAADLPAPRVPTVTERLRFEADELDRQADALEQRSVPAAGQVERDSVDELIAYVHALPLALAPNESEIRAWAARAGSPHEERIAAAPQGTDVARARVRYQLLWQAGHVDEASHARLVTVADLVQERMLAGSVERDERRRELWATTKAQLIDDGIHEGLATQRAWEVVADQDRAERAELEAAL